MRTEPKRICVVSDYSLTTLGGAETAYFEQVKTLGTRYEVTAMSSDCPRLAELGRQPGVTAIAVPIWFRLPVRGLPISRQTPQLKEFFKDVFRKRQIEVVHIHSEFAIAATALAAAHELGIPVVHTIHTFFWQTNWPIQRLLGAFIPRYHQYVTKLRPTRKKLADQPGNSALRNMTLTVAQKVDAIISPSAHQRDKLAASGLRNIQVIPNAMAFPADAKTLERVTPPLKILWIGRFVAEKRILPFLRATVKALELLPPGALEVNIIGDGEEKALALAIAKDAPAIKFHGRIPHPQVQQMIADSHLTALTSVGWDNQPMVIVESVTALRGVIYCDPALTEGLTGTGIPAFGEDEEELAALLVRLAEDLDIAVSASRAAKLARQEFATATFIDRTSAVYHQVATA